MSKVKFYFNTKSLKYERVQLKLWDRLKRVLSYLASGLVFASVTIWIAYTYFDSPKEKQLKREIDGLKEQYDVVDERISQMNNVLQDIQDRDDNIYRVIFEAAPSAFFKLGTRNWELGTKTTSLNEVVVLDVFSSEFRIPSVPDKH